MSAVYIKVEMVGDGEQAESVLMDRIRSLILQNFEVDSISYRSTSIVQTLEAFLTILLPTCLMAEQEHRFNPCRSNHL